MFQSLGPTELIIIFAIVLLLFGAGRITRVGRELGSAVGSFKDGLKDGTAEPDGTDEPGAASIGR